MHTLYACRRINSCAYGIEYILIQLHLEIKPDAPLIHFLCCTHCTHAQLKIGADVPIVKISTTAWEGIRNVCKRIGMMMPVIQPRGEQPASSSSSETPALMLIASSCVVEPVGDEEDAAVAVAAAAGDETMFITLVGRVVQVLTYLLQYISI